MKNYAISQFILLAYLISGGDVIAVNNDLTDGPQKATAARAQVTEETKKQTTEVNPKNNLKPSQSGVDGKSDQTEQAEAKQRLDLSVPDKIQGTTIDGNVRPKKKRGHLPVLFTNKNNFK